MADRHRTPSATSGLIRWFLRDYYRDPLLPRTRKRGSSAGSRGGRESSRSVRATEGRRRRQHIITKLADGARRRQWDGDRCAYNQLRAGARSFASSWAMRTVDSRSSRL